MGNIQDFAFVGVESLLVKDKKNKGVLCELRYLVGIALSDSQPIEYLRGGIDRLKLLPFKTDRETSITVTTATTSAPLLELLENSKIEEVEKNFDIVKIIEGINGSFTLPETPAEDAVFTVKALDDRGKESILVSGDGAAVGTYSITGNVIKTDASVKAIKVFYQVKKNAQVLKAKSGETQVFEVTALVVAQEVGTGAMYLVQIDVPSAVIQLNTQLNTKNEGGVPEQIEFTIDMLSDALKDYAYMLSFTERI